MNATKGTRKEAESKKGKGATPKKRSAPRAKKAKGKKAARVSPEERQPKIRPSVERKGWTFVTKATLHHVRISPRKARLMVNLIKGKQVEPALQILRFAPKKSARLILKLLSSAIMNAKEVSNVDVDSLWVIGGFVDQGRTMKRFMPRARGSAGPLRKRSSHITVELGQRATQV